MKEKKQKKGNYIRLHTYLQNYNSSELQLSNGRTIDFELAKKLVIADK